MKSKTLGILIASMASVALMGAGFSSWVVSGVTDAVEVSPVSVTVADVLDTRVEVKAEITEGALVFDAGGVEAAPGAIFTAGGSTENQDLSIAVKINVKAKSDAGISQSIKVAWAVKLPDEITNANLAAFGGATSSDATISGSEFTVTPLTTAGKDYNLTLNFAWGSAFGGVNPVKLTSSSLGTGDIPGTVEEVIANLNALKTSLTAGSIKITFTPSIVA